jgi:hypothetical protein
MKRSFHSLLIASLGLTLAGCGAGFESPASYDGNWQGSWKLSDDSASGALTMSLAHTGEQVSGSVVIDGTFCIGSANVAATVENGAMSGTFSNGIGSVEIDGDIDAADDFNGTFTVESGLCNGSRGSFLMQR